MGRQAWGLGQGMVRVDRWICRAQAPYNQAGRPRPFVHSAASLTDTAPTPITAGSIPETWVP